LEILRIIFMLLGYGEFFKFVILHKGFPFADEKLKG
jgi:hypothetical protein